MNKPTPEQAFQNLTQNTPPKLRNLPRWIRLRSTKVEPNKQTGVVDFVAVNADRQPATEQNPLELVSLDAVLDWLVENDQRVTPNKNKVVPFGTGAGLFIDADDDLTAIEVTKAFSEDGSLKPFAKTVHDALPMAYCERSRCGRNLTLIVSSSIKPEETNFSMEGVSGSTIGFHSMGWYVEFTGDTIGPVVDPVDNGSEALRKLIQLCTTQRRTTKNRNNGPKLPSVDAIKTAAVGRWGSVLIAAGMPVDALSDEPQPCPKCGGDDRFNVAKDFDETGAVFCRSCFTRGSEPKPGDGIATLRWFNELSFGEAVLWLANHLKIDAFSDAAPLGIIEAVCRRKRMPLDAFLKFGVKPATRGKDKHPVGRVEVYDEAGFVSSYFDIAPGLKGFFKRGIPAGMFFPGRTPKPGETWLVVEGVKDAAALVGLGYNAAGLPTATMNQKFANLFDGVHAVIVPDLDKPGQRGASRTGGNLIGIAASVRVARLPGEVKASGGEDVRDCLRRANGETAVRLAIANAKPWEPDPSLNGKDARPEVFVTLDEPKVIDDVIQHVGKLGWNDDTKEGLRVFVRGGLLSGVFASEDIGADARLSIRPLHPSVVRERIVSACQLLKEQGEGDDAEAVPARPDKWLIDGVAYRGYYGGSMRPLTGIIHAPTIRQDGSILQADGYDETTGLLLQSSDTFPPIPEQPTREDAAAAIELLNHVVVDFPFQDAADRTAWLGLVLSLIGRQCVAGCVPLFAITANIRGAGKSKLVDSASIIAYGHTAARKTFTRDNDELRKVITSIALEAVPSVLFDNVDIQMGGASLDAALTGITWSDRVLGSSKTTGSLPMRTVWSATGNNMAFGSDIARRVLPIRLQSSLESPETRTGFKHENLEAWTRVNRPALAVAALTILRAYFVAGCPTQPGGSWGSFEAWSSVIRGAIVWAGAADPLPTREAAAENDDSLRLLGLLISGIRKADNFGGGLTANEIEDAAKRISPMLEDNGIDELKEAIDEICGDRFNARTFGRRMRSYVGRVWDGHRIEAASAMGGVKRYRVVPAGVGETQPGKPPDALTQTH